MRAGAALVVLIALVEIAPARADEVVARDAMSRGVAALAAGNAAAALAEFQRAIAEAPDAPVPYRYAAEAQEQLAAWADAVASYRTYLRLRPDSRDAAEVAARIDRITSSHLTGEITVGCEPTGAAVALDDEPIGTTPVGPVRATAGRHRLQVSAAGHLTRRLEVTVTGGARVAVECVLSPLLPAAGGDPLRSTDTGPRPRRRAWYRRPWVWAVAGAVVVAGGVTVVLAQPDRPDTAGGDIPFP